MTAVLERFKSVAPLSRASELSPSAVLDQFLQEWTGTHPSERVVRLVSALNCFGWRCAVIDGGASTAAWRLLTSSGINLRLPVSSVIEGLRGLDAIEESGEYDLVILYDIPCSLRRVRSWLVDTPGRGAVLWLRQSEAVLLEDAPDGLPAWLGWLGRLCDRFLRLIDGR